MKVLVGFEFSGVVRRAFESRGHEAWSCDLLSSLDDSPRHMTRDIRGISRKEFMEYDLVILHPPCTYLCSSGIHWNRRVPGRERKTRDAIRLVQWLWDLEVPRLAIENPVGVLSTRWRRPDQIIQPYWFGHPETKKTCLWLKNLPLLVPTGMVEPQYQMNKDGTVYKDKKGKRYNPRHFMSGQAGRKEADDSLPRWALRSLTYTGIAEAMSKQWGDL